MTHDKNNIFQILFFLLCNCESFTFVLEVSFALFAVFNLWGLQGCEVINGSAPPPTLSGYHEIVNIRLLCLTIHLNSNDNVAHTTTAWASEWKAKLKSIILAESSVARLGLGSTGCVWLLPSFIFLFYHSTKAWQENEMRDKFRRESLKGKKNQKPIIKNQTLLNAQAVTMPTLQIWKNAASASSWYRVNISMI